MKFTDPDVRPTVRAPTFENIPPELRDRSQWVLWRFVWSKHSKQWAKVPFDAHTLAAAKSDDPTTWATFDAVQAIYVEGKGGFHGIGFVFSVDDPYFGADFDNCIKEGKIDPSVTKWVDHFDSYTEKSVSETGLHVIGKGVVGDGIKTGDFEVYDRGRYFTFSGNVGRRKAIEYRQAAVESFKKFLRPEVKTPSAPRPVLTEGGPTVPAVLERAFSAENGASLRSLYEGSVNGHKSHSEAVASLCWKFAFWCDRDPVLLDAVVRGSRLCDSKWDSRRGKQTWGAREVEKAIGKCTEFFDWNKTSRSKVGLSNVHADTTPSAKTEQQDDQWEPPATFYEHSRPPFPVEVLPDSIRPFVEGLARETQTPVDLPAMLSVTIASGAVAGKVRVQARPGWTEPTNIYCVCVLPPGNRKSAVFQSVSEPLEEIERDLVAATRDEIARAASEFRMLEERRVKLEKEASRADNPEDRKTKAAEAVAVAQQLAVARVPVAPRLIVSDATSEVLSTLLAEHGGRITMLSTEGGPFETMAGRYSNGIPNIDVFLKGHSGDTLRIDRRGRSEFVQQPALTIGLTVQPDVIGGLARNPGFRGRGLLARFFYCLPQSIVGCRQIDPQSLSDQHRKQFSRAIKLLAEIEPGVDRQGDPAPRLLYLTAEANALLREFEHDLEPKLADDAELGSLADWAGKLAGAVVRLAAVLWLIDRAENLSPWPEKIEADAMRRAIAIGQYLTQHARVAFAEMGADGNVENAKRVLRWIEKTATREFTRRDAHQAHRSRFKTVDEIDPALDLLESHNYIRPLIEAGDNRRPGRKASQGYAVNPYFLEASQSGLSITQKEFQDAITYEEGVIYA